MKKIKLKKIIAISLFTLLALSTCSCGISYIEAPEAEFSSRITQKNFGNFSIEYPSNWNVSVDANLEDTAFGDNFFEATSDFDENNLCSSLHFTKASETTSRKIKSIIKTDNVPDVVSTFQQTYGTDIELISNAYYKIDGKQCLKFKVSFEKNGNSYTLDQTYFVEENAVYILSVMVLNENDKANAEMIPFSLKFVD